MVTRLELVVGLVSAFGIAAVTVVLVVQPAVRWLFSISNSN